MKDCQKIFLLIFHFFGNKNSKNVKKLKLCHDYCPAVFRVTFSITFSLDAKAQNSVFLKYIILRSFLQLTCPMYQF